ncbi:hypothetical protein QGM71_02515 [Virgibacillus sp. C22-A2]|uniref:Uncharacterized protein n=1 Tax=Virgibacillus tibetensis TaxID=3042313 RepID=A0ABU6KB52_9BACI|nr:hypothetical protein [Virgibacillus sp. C22-A2]
MEKVKLTQEQADAIYQWRKCSEKDDSELVEKHIQGWVLETDQPLNDLDLDDFIKALYVGYEVEPEFEVGDWVVHDLNKTPRKILRESNHANGDCGKFVLEDKWGVLPDFLRHATPKEIKQEKERRWWSKHGREVWVIKEGDFLSSPYGGSCEVASVDENKGIRFAYGYGYYDWEVIKSEYKVACFIKNRLDKEVTK